jgi:tRNA uridine 5-carbamoylmethylation protein Kti12
MKAYVFRGAPASGKGTITKELIKLIPSKVAYLELDEFRWGFHLNNRKIEDITEDEHKLAYDNFLSVLENYCKNGNYNLVIEGLFSWKEHGVNGNMDDIVGILEKYNFDYTTFFLKADLNTLWERNSNRKHIVPADEFRGLYDYVGVFEVGKETLVDVNKNSLNETLAFLKKYL